MTVNTNELVDKATKPVVKPSHYIGDNGIEVKEILKGFLPRFHNGHIAHEIGSSVEYLLRSSTKDGFSDLKKASYILNRLVEDIESGQIEW